MDHVLYAPDEQELSSVPPGNLEAVTLCEIWSGLPPYDFSPTPSSTGKMAMKTMGENISIWIPPATVEAIEAAKNLDRKPLLKAHGRRRGDFIDFLVVEALPTGTSQEACIEEVKRFNHKQLIRARRLAK